MKKTKSTVKKTVKKAKAVVKATAKRSVKETKEKIVKSKKPKIAEEKPIDKVNPVLAYMTNQLDKIEKEENLSAGLDDDYRLPTDILVMDILLDGGINPGWFSVSGMETSWKSGCALSMAAACMRQEVPIIYYIDAENALKKKFARVTLGVDKLETAFGERDEKGNYLSVPKIKYSDENRLETIFRVLKKALLRLPDKRYHKPSKKWYYVFDRTQADKKKWTEMGLTDSDKKLYSQTGSYWFEAPDSTLQMFAVIDSIVAMVPEAAAEDEDKTTQRIAHLAGPLSSHIPQLKGLLKRKHAAIWVVNQLRSKPMVMYGPTEDEPGGHALKFFSDFRTTFTARAVPAGFERVKENPAVCWEPSVEGKGKDYYMFKSVKVKKSKTSLAGSTTWLRVWVKDHTGQPRGFDPVFDAWESLCLLGKIDGTRKRTFRINLPKLESIDFDWITFKQVILSEHLKSKKLFADYKDKLKVTKQIKIRAAIAQLLKTSDIASLMAKASSSEKTSEETDDVD